MNNIIDNSNFSLDIYGDKGNPHIVFFGGWGVSAASYRDRLSMLGEHFYIYGISLPGFGDNEPLNLKDNHIRGHAEFFSANILPQLDFNGGFVLMGHSTGAGVATLIADRHIDMVDKLVLVSPVGSPDPLNKSFFRMLNSIDIREALRYSTAEYWKRALPNMRLGVDAKYIDLSEPISSVINRGVDVYIYLSEEDKIAPPGKLADISDAKILWVEGGHGWFRNYPEDLLTSMIDIIYPVESRAGEEDDSFTLVEAIVNFVRLKANKNR